jgi:omega-amidase
MSGSFRLGLVQLAVTSQKSVNIANAAKKIKEAVNQGAKVVSLPECWNSP